MSSNVRVPCATAVNRGSSSTARTQSRLVSTPATSVAARASPSPATAAARSSPPTRSLASSGSYSGVTSVPVSTHVSTRTAGGNRTAVEQARAGLEAAGGVLGVEAGLDGVACRLGVGRHAGPGGDVEHQADEVEAGHELGHAVLDLEAGVDLEEVELAPRRVDQELDRAHRAVLHRAGQGSCRVVQPGAHLGGEVGRRRLLDDLLVAALHRAVAIAEHRHGAAPVADDLHLDVAGHGQEPLDEQGAGPEARRAGAGHARPGVGQVAGPVAAGHADAAAARRRLQQDGVADRLGLGGGRLEVGEDAGAGQQRHAGGSGQRAGAVLVAEGLDLRGRRPDEGEARRLDGAGEGGRLGQEAVAGVDGVGARVEGGLHDAVGAQVAVGRRRSAQRHGHVGLADVGGGPVRVGEHGDGRDVAAGQRGDDAAGDLAPVGDEDAAERGGPGGGGHRCTLRAHG